MNSIKLSNKNFTMPMFYCEVNKTIKPIFSKDCSDTFNLSNNKTDVNITVNLLQTRGYDSRPFLMQNIK